MLFLRLNLHSAKKFEVLAEKQVDCLRADLDYFNVGCQHNSATKNYPQLILQHALGTQRNYAIVARVRFCTMK